MATRFPITESQAPPLGLLLREVGHIAHWRRLQEPVGVVDVPVGQGRPVLVIPGFLASDGSTRPLRHALRQAGFKAHGWGQGRNFGLKQDVFSVIDARMDWLEARYGGPVSIVGWSLGGLIAREYAKVAPDRVDRVVTLGSPFSGDIRANNAWRLYELVARHKVDQPPIECALKEKPPVETIAIWSHRDGLIAAASARGEEGERDRAIEVGCGHIEMSFATEAQRAVIAALSE
jgi:pimeloyl-ACP methyl ester carboxylesterase